MAVGFVFLILANVTGLISPWVLKYAVDSLETGIMPGKLLFYASLILGVALVQGVFRFIMRRVLIGVSRHIEYLLRKDIFAHLQKLPLEFFQANPTGDIISRATSDLNNVRMFLGPGIMHFFGTVVLLITALIFMFSISPALTMVSLSPLPLASAAMMYFSARFYKRYLRAQEAYGRMSSRAQENFTGIRVVKSYVLEDDQIESFQRQNLDYLSENLHLARLRGLFIPAVGFLFSLSLIIVLWAGGRMIIQGRITLGDLVAFHGFMFMLIWPLTAFGWVINLFQRGAASGDRIKLILETVPAIRDPEEPSEAEEISGLIRFSNLDFQYPGSEEPVLQGIDMEIRAGEKVAFVGRTGSGKTTLAGLIPRLYNVERGRLTIDGIDVNDIPLSILRGAIGFVPQETFLFSDTIQENIALGADGEEGLSIKDAAYLSGMKPDIETFPSGYDTLLGERGITLSGGQKQRTSLARAVIRDPRILILDDVFSSVDAQTEQSILENLSGLMTGKTTIIITHRLASITDADRIFVLEDGSIAESGSHAELMKRGGLYAEMFRRQSIIAELERED
jgi:ATP-binding cassette subfamily B protein